MAKVTFDPSTLAKSAEVNANFTGTWDGTLMDDESIAFRHLNVTGMISPWATNTAPSGWKICNGESLVRATYADLFALIGTTYGSVDGTHFNLPDLRGKSIVGLSAAESEFDALGETGGEKYHILTTAELAAHSHAVTDPTHAHSVYDPSHRHAQLFDDNIGAQVGNQNPDSNGGSQQHGNTGFSATGIGIYGAATGISIQNAGGDSGHNNIQPYIVMNYIIKT